MSTKIGHFEILSELAKSPTSVVYKANDPESGQTVALKAIELAAFGEHAKALEQALLEEADRTKILNSPNITNVYGAGEIDGRFCAAMEYVQGNSIATMLARKEGFSIWDLLDIARQLSQGFEHATSHGIVHYSLEPSKIMCGWDGTVKILSLGISSVGNFVQHVGGEVSSILYYMSPEQFRGEATDARSNLFTLGAMFYEMVTERKAFDREDVESLRQSVLESTPVAPVHVNPKVHPLLSDIIMKALAKDPAERYQTGRQLLDELEKCKEAKSLVAKKPEAPKSAVVSDQGKAVAQSKFVNAQPAQRSKSAPVAQSQTKASVSKTAPISPAKSASVPAKVATPKAAAAAAGLGSNTVARTSTAAPELDLSRPVVATSSRPGSEAVTPESAYMSSAVIDEPQVETFEQSENAPKVAVDPMMAEEDAGQGSSTSFSDISELPPLKETYVEAPPSTPDPEANAPVPTYATVLKGSQKADEKPKVQPREVAEKAIKEIKNVPPKLMMYSLAGAGALIVLIGIGVTIYIHGLGSDDDAGAPRKPVAAQTEPTPEQPPVVQKNEPAPAPVQSKPEEIEEQPVATGQKPVSPAKQRNAKKKPVAPAPIVPAQLAVDSTPQGAQVQIDGKSDPSWMTPFALTNLEPGQHSITVSKAGYVTDTRTVDVTSGGRANAVVRLAPMTATLIVKSDPPGGNILVDGRDVGTKTPAQVSIANGQHVVLVRMSGYLDESMTTQFTAGQTFNFSPTLRALGNVDSIKTVGKVSKLFGGKGQPGQATVSIHTQPKGAQVAINQHMLDKSSPVDVMLDPGNYEVDITMTGYAPVHKVITADKKGKVVIDEVLQLQ